MLIVEINRDTGRILVRNNEDVRLFIAEDGKIIQTYGECELDSPFFPHELVKELEQWNNDAWKSCDEPTFSEIKDAMQKHWDMLHEFQFQDSAISWWSEQASSYLFDEDEEEEDNTQERNRL